ncbi:Alanyl-tRNA synthetase, class IIc-like protein [Salinarchaeum sp. Harcht-Bsk1]|uniref:alanyl-tRNA editing protein n=1 Tax=Salinarchaeum sp. Harcht-Bsk1 TaxID=1333523 RepID=UPI000342497F|nr:alanyl-tRNA editing protein [Salinarchaeum sp. Harcht-Bsk1]AGN01906.1 Alanyl-tRNA synthetase, class IIc-like protein [Salinarchaeum sp. Harcht-Bsk1]
MTETPYLEDSYQRTIEATVERALDDRVVLDRTICYPEGGGQPADHGTLTVIDGADVADGAEWAITDVQKQDTIYHHLDPAADAPADPAPTPSEGATVEIDLDWERRLGHMRHHTAQHLLSRVLIDEFDAGTEGNQVYADGARIDCEQDRFTEADLALIETRVNELIEDERPVEWYELDREVAEERLDPERTRIELLPDSITELRIVEIEDFDRTACAGTHVANTGECGTFELTGRESKGGGVERLRFELR